MANGKVYGSQGGGLFGYYLLDAQSASDNGVWCDVRGMLSATIYVDVVETGGTIEIMVSIAEEKPANATAGEVWLTITPSNDAKHLALLNLDSKLTPICWIKAKKTAGGTPGNSTCLHWGLTR